MIYIVRAGETEMTKIGFAAHIPSRLRAIQAGCWERLELLRGMDGDPATEGWMHRQFRAHRVQRDWFTFHPDMLTIEPPAVSDIPSANSAVEQFVALFGGREVVARITGVKPNAVTQWRKFGVPFRVWFDLIDAAQRLGIPGIDRNFLGSLRTTARQSS